MVFKIGVIAFALFSVFECHAQERVTQGTPNEKNGVYSLRVGDAVMLVDPATGGRITSLTLGGEEFLSGKEVNEINWGSTLWPSPQADWNWPPPSSLDREPYSVLVEQNVVKMVSERDPKTGLVFTKEFSVHEKEGSFSLKYTLTNRSDTVKKVAPWEVTRVRTNGLAFFPFGKGERRGGLLSSLFEKKGISWFLYQQENLPVKGDRQIYADGSEGWMAQLNDGVLLVKKFPDVPFEKNAPQEGEIELYASPVLPGKSYVEIEHQGAYQALLPGESLTWEVNWYLRRLPQRIKGEVGNEKLVKYVRKLIK